MVRCRYLFGPNNNAVDFNSKFTHHLSSLDVHKKCIVYQSPRSPGAECWTKNRRSDCPSDNGTSGIVASKSTRQILRIVKISCLDLPYQVAIGQGNTAAINGDESPVRIKGRISD